MDVTTFFLSTRPARKLSLNGYQYTKEKDNVTEAGCKTYLRCENRECKVGYKLLMTLIYIFRLLNSVTYLLTEHTQITLFNRR